MRSNSSSALNRRARRARIRAARRSAIVSAGLAIGLIATAGFASGGTLSAAQASSASDSFGAFELASFTTTTDPIAVVTEDGTDEISTDAHDAIETAAESIDAAAKIAADIEDSGLKIESDSTEVDTSALDEAASRLEGSLDLPAPLVPALTADVTELIASVDGEVAGLREALKAAEKKKAEEEAREKARREAEAKAKAEAEAAAAAAAAASSSSSSSGSSSSSSAASTPVPSGGGGASASEAKSIARAMVANRGWGGDQYSCLESLWQKESGWNYKAYNASSGAYGIPQSLPGSKMASAGADWQTNAATQISWGLGYISGRYGTPCGAWSHSKSYGWY